MSAIPVLLMPPETLRAIHDIQVDLDVLWINADYGSERRKALNEVRELIEAYKMSRIRRDRETHGR